MFQNPSMRHSTKFLFLQGKVKHLQLQTHELLEYEQQLESVLRRYLRRLQWLLGSSRRTFGTVIEKRVGDAENIKNKKVGMIVVMMIKKFCDDNDCDNLMMRLVIVMMMMMVMMMVMMMIVMMMMMMMR